MARHRRPKLTAKVRKSLITLTQRIPRELFADPETAQGLRFLVDLERFETGPIAEARRNYQKQFYTPKNKED
jgi:hypothetical protein